MKVNGRPPSFGPAHFSLTLTLKSLPEPKKKTAGSLKKIQCTVWFGQQKRRQVNNGNASDDTGDSDKNTIG